MRCLVVATVLATAPLFAQPPAPEVLPPTVLEPVNPKPLTPAEAAKQRDDAIKGLKEELVTFDPASVVAKQVEGRWHVRTANILLKDFGGDRTSAVEAARLIQDLRVNQMGKVPGSNPPFEYWLADGKPPRVMNTRAVILPVAARSLRAEGIGGTWVVTDGAKGLYDFGTDVDAARRAAIVFWKYGFNQIGVTGGSRATLLFPLMDPRQAALEKASPVTQASAVGVLQDVSKTSLLLPGNVYAGPKKAIDVLKLEVVRRERGESVLVCGDEVLGRFGGNEMAARQALRALQNAHVNEVARIGSTGVPLFLMNGLAVNGEPLGATRMSMRADRVKTQKIRDTYWVVEDGRPLIEAGTKADADLLIHVIRHFNLKAMCLFGQPESGGLRLLTTGR